MRQMEIIPTFSPEKLVTGKKSLAKYRFFFQTMGNILIVPKFAAYTYLQIMEFTESKKLSIRSTP